MTIDLTISPIYRIGGQETNSLPGLVALPPPQTPARGRERDRLTAYLLLTGNATISTSEYMQVATDAANTFYKTSGAITSALKAAAERVNHVLLERNMGTSKSGQFAVGWLTLAVVRETQCTFALSGPMHVYRFTKGEVRHIHEPAVSGKGLGTNQTTSIHYAQTSLEAGDRLLFFGRAPDQWKAILEDTTPGSLDAIRRRLIAATNADLNAVLVQATEGTGILNLLGTNKPEAEEKESAPAPTPQVAAPPEVESTPKPVEMVQDKPIQQGQEKPTEASSAPLPAHIVQPSAYAIPPQQEETPRPNPLASLPKNTAPRDFPASIPRLQPGETLPMPAPVEPVPSTTEAVTTSTPEAAAEPVREYRPRPRRREYPEWTRQLAKAIASGIQLTRRTKENIGERLKIFLPRLLPNTEPDQTLAPSNFTMAGIAIVIPLIVVVVTFVMWTKYGRSQQYDLYLAQAQQKQAQALVLTNPIEQRQAWESVLLSVSIAETHRKTPETGAIRQQADAKLDELLGITRMQFNPAFSSSLGIEISRLAASETDLFLLDARTGEALHAQPSPNGRGFQIDTTFSCKPGVYGNYTVGDLVDILTLPLQNSINATLLGVDAAGNLLYCAPGQVAQAIPLPPPDTNWGRVNAFTLSDGNLYVLDASARAVWVYNGKDGAFIDRPYFFFGGQTPEKQDVIDLIVSGDDLYMLHGDGHLSTCSYSRIETKPTRCEDPTPLVNPFAAYQNEDLFTGAHFTQMLFAPLPDQSILLLDADAQSVLRFAPRTLELQNQFRPAQGTANPIPSGTIGAVAVGPNHVLYLALNGQVYFATNLP
jgi:hypothetical protein